MKGVFSSKLPSYLFLHWHHCLGGQLVPREGLGGVGGVRALGRGLSTFDLSISRGQRAFHPAQSNRWQCLP